MGWNLNELTASAEAPAAASNLTGYVFPAHGTQHVHYRGADHHVHELWWDRNGWHHRDLTATSRGPAATGELAAYALLSGGVRIVVHASADGHLHELRATAAAGGAEVVRHLDLSHGAGSAPAAVGSPAAFAVEKAGSRHVVYRDGAGRLHELWNEAPGGDGRWHHQDLTAAAGNAALAASDPAAFAWESAGSRHVVYRGTDQRVHELRCEGGRWQHTDLGAAAEGAPPAAGAVSGYVFAAQGTAHVNYRAADGHIHELWRDAAGWHHEDLSAETGAPAAADDPSSYMFNLQGSQHVLFRGTDQRIHELWWDVNGWHYEPVTTAAPAPAGRPAGYAFEAQKTQHLVYRQVDGRVAELWWQPEGSGAGGAGKTAGDQLATRWDPITFDAAIPVAGSAALTLSSDGGWSFSGHFHDSGFPAYSVALVWAVRGSAGTLFTFATSGEVYGTLGSGSRDFTFRLSGSEPALKAHWDEIRAGWNWQAQAGTQLDWAKLWGEVRGAVGEVRAIVAVVGPIFGPVVG